MSNCDWCMQEKEEIYVCGRCNRNFCVDKEKHCAFLNKGILNACPCRSGFRKV